MSGTAAPLPPARPARLGDCDAIVLVSFGGPDGPDDVLPFLANVSRGRDVPPERLAEVAIRYQRFGGRSPINDQNRALLAALRTELDVHDVGVPLYWGNRNWHPLLPGTVARMAADGVERAVAFVTSAFSSYPGCRQYLDDIAAATAPAGSPRIDKLPVFGNHPGFVDAMADRLLTALAAAAHHDAPPGRVVFTAHSIPTAMAASCDYEVQLRDSAAVIAGRSGVDEWDLVFQSRSGPPRVPWLGPDVGGHLRALHDAGVGAVTVVPLGFVSDHMEVVHDLDIEAAATAAELGMSWTRVPTVGTHPRFVSMIRELITEHLDPTEPRRALGRLGPRPVPCAAGCCAPAGALRPA